MEGKDGRTEPATGKKRNEERQKGNLCVSQEVVSFAGLFLGLVGLWLAAPGIYRGCAGLMQAIFSFEALKLSWNGTTAAEAYGRGMFFVLKMIAPLLILLTVGAIVSNMAQTKPFFSTKALKMSFGALNPVKGLKRLFSLQSVVKLFFGLGKLGVIVLTVWYVLRNDLWVILDLSRFSGPDSVEWVLRMLFRLSMTVTLVFLVIAVIDWFHTHYKYEKSLMMTKEEVKDEMKQKEVNPLIKRAQGRKMRELSLLRMMAAVPKAQVVITNPTHVAVALEYDPETMNAPRVVAKGLRRVAERIKKLAAEHSIPIIEKPELARALYKHVKVGHEIPSKFYEAVANLLAFLHRIGKGIRMAV